MINKIYIKIKQFIHNEWKFLIILLLLVGLTIYPVDCYIITGGGIISATDRVNVKGKKEKKGSFNLAYVSELKGTLYTYLLSYIIPSFERESTDNYKYDKTENTKDIDFRNNLLLNEANNNAIYVAYTKARKTIKVKSKKLFVYYVDKEADTDLEVGDEIIEVNGVKINDYDELRELINTLDDKEAISIKIKKNNNYRTKTATIFTRDNQKYIGINLITDTEYKLSPKIDITFKKSEGGPSGGLMMSLEIYSQLIKKDLTKGRKIVGTGTINKDGTCGEIDGVKYKLKGAVKNSADIFIVPTGKNYEEAVKEKKKHNYKIKIIEAKTFSQVVKELS